MLEDVGSLPVSSSELIREIDSMTAVACRLGGRGRRVSSKICLPNGKGDVKVQAGGA